MTLTKQARDFSALQPGDRVRIMRHGAAIPATLLHRARSGDGGWHALYADRAYGELTTYVFDDDVRPFDSIDLSPYVSRIVKRIERFEAHVRHCELSDGRRAADRLLADVVTILWPTFSTWGEFCEAVAARTSERWVYEWLCALDDVSVFDDDADPFWRWSRTSARRAAALSSEVAR